MSTQDNEHQNEEKQSLNFIEQIVDKDVKDNRYGGKIVTRFPPEPNGYLHIGHAKAICLDFGIARKYHGQCNLRLDDTNPTKENTQYVDSIKEDIEWLGFEWTRELYASDYFDQLYEWAEMLVRNGKAYVCEMSAEEISESRGTPTEPGKYSPWRDRPAEESLELLRRMKAGEFEEGQYLLRAKIDMASPNMHMRDPVMYRIRKAHHHRTGDKWCIYPMYDWAHGQSDYIEGVTHSLCTLEFEVHRPLYDWFIDQIKPEDTAYRPRQFEFARLNLSYTIMSKRKLQELVEREFVDGWDDPRMPTISGLRRRGYTPDSIKNFVDRVGIAKRENVIDMGLLEFMIREDLNKKAPRYMGVLNPLKIVLNDYPEELSEYMDIENNPEDENAGSRKVPFSKEIYIERDDFMEDPPKKFFRLAPGKEVRLKGAYIIKCEEVIKDEEGNITELHCSYDPDSKSGMEGSKRKVKGTLHWVSAGQALDVEVRLYDRLFNVEDPNKVPEGGTFLDNLNPDSLKILQAKVEPALDDIKPEAKVQFQRLGYFYLDYKYSTKEKKVFNRTVTLKDTWAKIASKK